MAGFFSLEVSTSTNSHHQQDLYTPPNSNLFHPVIQNNNQFQESQLGFSVGPTTKLLDHHQSIPHLTMMMMRSSTTGIQEGNCSNNGRIKGSINCQDCGNQAKKECVHMRCRTCCKNRGFECQTHVKSTWVPAAKRRERQQQHHLQLKRLCHVNDHHYQPNSTTAAAASNSSLGCSTSSTRLAPSSSALAAGGTLEQVGTSSLPPEVTSTAVFKCVRVSPIDQGEDGQLEQLAYQTSVNIGGHLFKGILYDQGHQQDYHQQQQPRYNNINQHLITNDAHHDSYSFDPRMTNVYQYSKSDHISYPGASNGTHLFP